MKKDKAGKIFFLTTGGLRMFSMAWFSVEDRSCSHRILRMWTVKSEMSDRAYCAAGSFREH